MTMTAVANPAEQAAEIQETTCLACGSAHAKEFFRMEGVPVLCNAPCDTAEAARAFPTGPVALAFCPECGLVFNHRFRPELLVYDQGYENSLHYSPQFDSYIRGLAADLVERLNLRDKDMIEIGCGKGDFLSLMCNLGNNRGVGFDPSFEDDRSGQPTANMRIIRDLYTERYSDLACDLLTCRQTLEHIPDPAAFVRSIRAALRNPQATTFFEVPNALYTLRHRGIWDIIYEHVSYFWALSLHRLFAASGFEVRSVRETYGGQFLCIEAGPGGSTALPDAEALGLNHVTAEAVEFAKTFQTVFSGAEKVLDRLRANQQRAVIWGAGSKGVMFLNLFKNRQQIDYAIDINPHKQGKFIPGAGQAIVGPEFLTNYQPSVVFLMNPLYRDEIGRQLASLGVHAELVAV